MVGGGGPYVWWSVRVVVLGVLGSLVLASASCKSTREGPEWATVLDWEADPDVIEDAELQAGITASGLPWRVLDNESGIEFLLVLPGSYLRGAAPEDPYDRTNERPQHEVVLTRPFYLGLYEVTNAQLRRFLPEHDSGPFPRDSTVSMNGDDYPAVLVSWDVATAFSEHFSLRLPTEAEWEYAARAGVTTRYPWGNDITEGGGWGNGFDAPVKRTYPEMDWEAFPWDDGWEATAPVGTFRRNAWGFYDMFGNAWEWVFDGLDDELYSTLAPSVTDPVHSDGENRILRGGGIGNTPRGSGIPYRWGTSTNNQHFGNGFRVARSP